MPTDKALPLLGMVLVTHGRLAEELVRAMEHVVGPQRAIATVCIGPNDDMEMRRERNRRCDSRTSTKGAASSC